MKLHQEIINFFDSYPESERQFAQAILFRADGSTYRKSGARMLIHLTGEYAGGISGGCLESDVQKKAKMCMLLNRNETVLYNTSKEKKGVGSNLGCDGNIEILIHPMDGNHPFSAINTLRKIQGHRKPVTVLHIIRSYRNEWDTAVGSSFTSEDFLMKFSEQFPLLNEQIEGIHEQPSSLFLIELNGEPALQIFAEIILPEVQLIVIGDQRDVIPISQIAHTLGWKITLCGREKKYPETIKSFAETLEADELKNLNIDSFTAVVFMSHDFEADVKNVPLLIDSRAFYFGILGPEKRKKKLLNEINRSEMESKIFGPVGLNLGSRNPEEIALSICAQIQQQYSHRIQLIQHTPIHVSHPVKS